MSDSEFYCIYCQRILVASNMDEVESGEHTGYLFVHDSIDHGDEINPEVH